MRVALPIQEFTGSLAYGSRVPKTEALTRRRMSCHDSVGKEKRETSGHVIHIPLVAATAHTGSCEELTPKGSSPDATGSWEFLRHTAKTPTNVVDNPTSVHPKDPNTVGAYK